VTIVATSMAVCHLRPEGNTIDVIDLLCDRSVVLDDSETPRDLGCPIRGFDAGDFFSIDLFRYQINVRDLENVDD
jgi:hypothetical protein